MRVRKKGGGRGCRKAISDSLLKTLAKHGIDHTCFLFLILPGTKENRNLGRGEGEEDPEECKVVFGRICQQTRFFLPLFSFFHLLLSKPRRH